MLLELGTNSFYDHLGQSPLLTRISELAQSKSTKAMSETGIPRNVNYYRHIIDSNNATESDVQWVLKLRGAAAAEEKEKLRR